MDALKLSKTVPLSIPTFTKLGGVAPHPSKDKVEDFALGGYLRPITMTHLGKVFDLNELGWLQTLANFVKLGIGKGTVFDSEILPHNALTNS